MQANWSLILNVLLLIGVIVAIGRLMKARRQSFINEQYQPTPAVPVVKPTPEAPAFGDDIIAVRKVNRSPDLGTEVVMEPAPEMYRKPMTKPLHPRILPRHVHRVTPRSQTKIEPQVDDHASQSSKTNSSSIMIFLLAKENRQFAGYELLQTVLSAGLRFGEGHLFHRHQFSNGQGPVLCSLAAATSSGVFDLQNIGAFSVRGLCLFMHASQNPSIDAERFSLMLDTAKQLSEGLDAHVLDDQRKPLTQERIVRYHAMLNIEQTELEMA